jgi:UDP-N-acetylglucosamine--N-acetylmuramyl-(pentapeptide) pyrophosphoryl-undecaprenol N-acetylglucosamine transferase
MRILVVTGASGGHIFPALAFLENLKSKVPDAETLLLLPRNNAVKYIDTGVSRVGYISITGAKPTLSFKNIVALYNFCRGSFESLFIILRFRPDAVAGFGSLASIPVILFAWLFRVKTIIHEQNVIPGSANRLLGAFADRIAISFAETREYFSRYKNKVVLTGNPLRRELTRIEKKKALDFFRLNPDRFTILAIGGSQGSSSINTAFFKAISSLSAKADFQVIHIAGEKDYAFLKCAYRDLKIDSRIFGFFDAMQYAYSASDLAVSRAGATSITELIFFKVPAIISPYPYAWRHQMANAEVLRNASAAIVIEDGELGKDKLAQNIASLINNPRRLEEMRSAYAGILMPQAEGLLVQEITSLN